MNSLIQKIDEIIEQNSLLKHPFYQMWSDGKLSQESLAGYSKEYFQLVKEVPSFVGKVISHASDGYVDELRSNQQEEDQHITPWINFACALGVKKEELEKYQGLEKTNKAVLQLGSLLSSFEDGAVAMYAFEKEIPKISQTKLDGLCKFYGITQKDAVKYFELHKEADIRHAATWQKIIEKSSKNDKLIETAQKSVSAQNLLLDSCYEAYC